MKSHPRITLVALVVATLMWGCEADQQTVSGPDGIGPRFRHGGAPPHGADGPTGSNTDVVVTVTNGIMSVGAQPAQIEVDSKNQLNVCCGGSFNATLNFTPPGGTNVPPCTSRNDATGLAAFLTKTLGGDEQPAEFNFQVHRKSVVSHKHQLTVSWTEPSGKRIRVILAGDVDGFPKLNVTEQLNFNADPDKAKYTFTNGAVGVVRLQGTGALHDRLFCLNNQTVAIVADRSP